MFRHDGYIPRELFIPVDQDSKSQHLERSGMASAAPEPMPQQSQGSSPNQIQHQATSFNQKLDILPLRETSTSLGINETYGTLCLRRKTGVTENKVFRAWSKMTKRNQRLPEPIADIQQDRLDVALRLALKDLRRKSTRVSDISRPINVEFHRVGTEKELNDLLDDLIKIAYTLKKGKYSLLPQLEAIIKRLAVEAKFHSKDPLCYAFANGLYTDDLYAPKDRPLIEPCSLLLEFILEIDMARRVLGYIGDEIVKPGRFTPEMQSFAHQFKTIAEDSWFRERCESIVESYDTWMIERIAKPCFDWTKDCHYMGYWDGPIYRALNSEEWKRIMALVDTAGRTQITAEMLASNYRFPRKLVSMTNG